MTFSPLDAASDSFSVVMGGSCICPGEVISYRCTVLDNGVGVTTWSGTAVDAAFTQYNCDGSIDFHLVHSRFDDPGSVSVACGGGAVVAQSVGVMLSSPDNCYISEFTVTTFPGLDGTVIECSLSGGFRDVGNSSLIIAGRNA